MSPRWTGQRNLEVEISKILTQIAFPLTSHKNEAAMHGENENKICRMKKKKTVYWKQTFPSLYLFLSAWYSQSVHKCIFSVCDLMTPRQKTCLPATYKSNCHSVCCDTSFGLWNLTMFKKSWSTFFKHCSNIAAVIKLDQASQEYNQWVKLSLRLLCVWVPNIPVIRWTCDRAY